MLKMLLAVAVVVGILIGATQIMHKFHSNSPTGTDTPGAPVVITVKVPNPIGGDSGSQGGGGQLVIP